MKDGVPILIHRRAFARAAPAAATIGAEATVGDFIVGQLCQICQILQFPRFAVPWRANLSAERLPQICTLICRGTVIFFGDGNCLQQQLNGSDSVSSSHAGPLAAAAMVTAFKLPGNYKTAIDDFSGIDAAGSGEQSKVGLMCGNRGLQQFVCFVHESKIIQTVNGHPQIVGKSLVGILRIYGQFAIQLERIVVVVLIEQLLRLSSTIRWRLFHCCRHQSRRTQNHHRHQT